jgi:predicted nucleotidyltransferase
VQQRRQLALHVHVPMRRLVVLSDASRGSISHFAIRGSGSRLHRADDVIIPLVWMAQRTWPGSGVGPADARRYSRGCLLRHVADPVATVRARRGPGTLCPRRKGRLASMRLQRGVSVAGVDPEMARQLARSCHDRWTTTGVLADRVRLPAQAVAPLLRQLADAGFLERRDACWAGETDEWNTTLAGGALTMASFLRPMPRARAERLFAGVLERAVAYNADDSHPLVITQIAVFGSYLRPDATELGDLDLAVECAERRPGSASPVALLEHARASGRRFPNFVAELSWAQAELLRLLRSRSAYINVHTEDVSRFTDDWHVVYTHITEPTEVG